MDPESSISHRHPYMRKGHSIKVDVLTSQAVVSPIFRKLTALPIVEKCTKVYGAVTHDSDSENDDDLLLQSKLCNKYKSVFNKISKESVIDYQKYQKESNKRKQENQLSTHNLQSSTRLPDKRQKTEDFGLPKLYIDHKYNKSPSGRLRPFLDILTSVSQWFSKLNVPGLGYNQPINSASSSETVLAEAFLPQNGTCNKIHSGSESCDLETSTTLVENENNYNKEVKTTLDYNCVKRLSIDLVSFVHEMDRWKHKAAVSLSKSGPTRKELRDAVSLLEEYNYLTSGLISCELFERLVSEMGKTEEYTNKLKDKFWFLFNECDKQVTVKVSLVERMLKEGLNTRFMSPEYVTFCRMFYNTSSLKYLLDESMLESDFEHCASLIEESDESQLRIPKIQDFKNELDRSVWINNAIKCSQKHVTYAFLSEVVESTPESMKEDKLFKKLKEKKEMALEWIERLSAPKFRKIVSVDNYKLVIIKEKENQIKGRDSVKFENKLDEADSENEERNSLKPEDLEAMHQMYQKIEVAIPCYRNLESAYTMWKRFERRLKKLDKMIGSENCSNCTMESLGVLQHSENIMEFMDIRRLLEPIKNEVEVTLNYEKKCRALLNKFNSWSITNECVNIKSDWNTLVNFRKNAKVNKNDIMDVIKIVEAYKSILGYDKNEVNRQVKDKLDDKPREDFEEFVKLKEEFKTLKIKNWPLFRNLEEICNSGMQLKERMENGINDLKEGYKSDEVMANIIVVTMEILRFGANLDLEDQLLKTLKYCLWMKKIYKWLDKLHKYLMARAEGNSKKGERSKNQESNGKNRKEGNAQEISREMEGKDKRSNLERDRRDEYDAFLAVFKSLVKDPRRDHFEEMIDREQSMGSYLNIESPENLKLTSKSPSNRNRDEMLKSIMESCEIFELSEFDLVKMFNDP